MRHPLAEIVCTSDFMFKKDFFMFNESALTVKSNVSGPATTTTTTTTTTATTAKFLNNLYRNKHGVS